MSRKSEKKVEEVEVAKVAEPKAEEPALVETDDTVGLKVDEPTVVDPVETEIAPTGNDEAPKLDPVTERVRFSKTMTFPVEVTLPMQVVIEIGGNDRTIIVESEKQELHPSIVEWMKTHPRWKKFVK